MDPTPAEDSGAKPLPPPKTTKTTKGDERDFFLHLEAYLARRNGVDKLLKISRYAVKIVLASSISVNLPLTHRLKSFESSVGASRTAFRLGKFVQDVNALRRSSALPQSAVHRALYLIAYGGEGLDYFVEQFVWLAKTGLIPAEHSKMLQKISAWAGLIGHVGSLALKVGGARSIRSSLESKMGESCDGVAKVGDGEEMRKLKEKLLLKQMSIVQDIADTLMAFAGVRDGKGYLSDPLLMASAGLLSALISTQKNWSSC